MLADLPSLASLVLGVFSEILLRSAVCSTQPSSLASWLFYLAQMFIAACTGLSEFWFLIDSSFAYIDGFFLYEGLLVLRGFLGLCKYGVFY